MHTRPGIVLRSVSFAFGLLGMATVICLSSPARAQDDETVQMARERFQEGVDYYDQRDYEKARLAFLQAYALKAHPAVLLNLAQSELRADRPADAATHFAKYLRENDEASEAERQEAELGFAAARTKVAEVDVTVDVEGATVSVDGDEVGKSPLPGPLYLAPGTHTIEARSASGKTASAQVSAGPGQSDSASLMVAGAPPAAGSAMPPPPPGEETEGGILDEDLELSTEGGGGAGGWVARHPLTTASAAVAVAAAGTGTVFAILAKRDYDSANSIRAQILHERDVDIMRADFNWPTRGTDPAPPCGLAPAERTTVNNNAGGGQRLQQYDNACTQFNNTQDDAQLKKTIAIIGFAGAGAFAAGAVGFYFLDESMHSDDDESAARHSGPFDFHARVVPIATPTTQGLSIVGTF